MQNSVLKEQLINIFEQTENDIDSYCRVLSSLPLQTEDEKRRRDEALRVAQSAQEKIKDARSIVEDSSVEDTEEAKAAAKDSSRQMAGTGTATAFS